MQRPQRPRGFTMVEMLLVIVIIGLITVVAFPSLSTFATRNDDASAATKVSRLINRVKDQARRRNRAHLVEIDQMNRLQPQGMLTIHETAATSCSLASLDNARILQRVPFGATQQLDYRGQRTDNVGITGWFRGEDEPVNAPLILCASPSGALAVGVGANAAPLSGQVGIEVQLFDRAGGGWRTQGPPRVVGLTYAGNARLGLGLGVN